MPSVAPPADNSRIVRAVLVLSACLALGLAVSWWLAPANTSLAPALYWGGLVVALALLGVERFTSGSRFLVLHGLLWLAYFLVEAVANTLLPRSVFQGPPIIAIAACLSLLALVLLAVAVQFIIRQSHDTVDEALRAASLWGSAVSLVVLFLGPALFNGDWYGGGIPLISELGAHVVSLSAGVFGLRISSCGIDSCWSTGSTYAAAAWLLGAIVTLLRFITLSSRVWRILRIGFAVACSTLSITIMVHEFSDLVTGSIPISKIGVGFSLLFLGLGAVIYWSDRTANLGAAAAIFLCAVAIMVILPLWMELHFELVALSGLVFLCAPGGRTALRNKTTQ